MGKTKKSATDAAALQPAVVTRLELEVRIDAKRARVWESLTSEIAGWWRTDFCVGGERAKMTVEPHVGGRMFEDWGGGAGAMWGTNLVYDPGKRLEVVGCLTPDFGGPATSIVQYALEEDGKATILKLRHSVFGRADEETGASLGSGWKMLFDALKAYAEGRRK
jgi:uncharacterized protein YndB with AHSA1/START domain